MRYREQLVMQVWEQQVQTLKGRVDHGGLSPEEAAAERQTLDRIVTDLEREGHDAFEHLIRLPVLPQPSRTHRRSRQCCP